MIPNGKTLISGSLDETARVWDLIKEAAEGGDVSRPQVGQRCKAKFKGKGKLYPGEIRELNEDGTFRVDFDDGDVDKKVKLKVMKVEDGDKPIMVIEEEKAIISVSYNH